MAQKMMTAPATIRKLVFWIKLRKVFMLIDMQYNNQLVCLHFDKIQTKKSMYGSMLSLDDNIFFLCHITTLKRFSFMPFIIINYSLDVRRIFERDIELISTLGYLN